MNRFATPGLSADRTLAAPDLADVRVLPGSADGRMAHFELAAGRIAAAPDHSVAAVAMTMPPWPDADETVSVHGPGSTRDGAVR